MSAFNTNLSTTRKKANGVNAPLSQPQWVWFKVETAQGPWEDIALHRRGVYVFVWFHLQLSFFFILWKKTPPFPPGWQSQPGALPAPAELCSQLSSAHFSLLSLSLAVVFVTIPLIFFSPSQGRGSNVIHCRKDGTWSGSFHLCREMQGQCALPTQLNSHLKLQCAGGYGIGL